MRIVASQQGAAGASRPSSRPRVNRGHRRGGGTLPTWSPSTYLQFADERGRPFVDLLARVAPRDPEVVVDLGCGPGQLTATLTQRWPRARVYGLDSSPEMIQRAQEHATDRLSFSVADLRLWQPAEPLDVLVSNATLQWVP